MSPDCQNIRELMDSYLSGELSVETNHLVLRHLGTCQVCDGEARRRQRTRTLLAQALDVRVDVERARRRVTHAVDREQRSWGRSVRWWGVAAALIVGVLLVQWLSMPVDAAAYDDSARNHIVCALSYPASVTYDPERAARNLAAPFEGLADSIGLEHGAYRVIDAHMCPYEGRDYAHVVLRGDGRTLSLFIEPGGRGALPRTSVRTMLPGDAGDVNSTTRLGYRVSATATAEHRLFVIAERPADAPDDIANELLLSAVRFVRTLER